MAFTFLKAVHKLDIGKSLFDEEGAGIAQEIIDLAKEKGVEIILPKDFVVSDQFGEGGEIKTVNEGEPITGDFMGLDCGPASRKANAEAIAKAKAIIWNGPMGVFEMESFAAGTKEMMDNVVAATED